MMLDELNNGDRSLQNDVEDEEPEEANQYWQSKLEKMVCPLVN
jgi:hypothetical protein